MISGGFLPFPLRSLLLVAPGTGADIAAAAASGADALVLDAEDAVRMLTTAGRDLAGRSLIRVAPLASGTVAATLDAVMPARPLGIVLTGVEDGADVTRISALLRPHEATLGIADGATRIVATLDTPSAILGAGGFAGASARLLGLIPDPDALAAALGTTERRDLERHIRATTLMAATAARVAAFDQPSNTADIKALEQDVHAARATGFAGKVAAHPDQVAIINAGFSRSAAPNS